MPKTNNRIISVSQDENKYILKYLEGMGIERIESIQTFKSRKNWFQPDDGNIPDAFMMYLCQSGHKIIINSAKVNCTNNVHRLYLKNKLPNYKIRLITISMMSSFSQLSCELTGREYGSGALKLEPTLAKAINILVPDASFQSINSCFNKINTYLENSDLVNAISSADAFIVKHSKIDGVEDKLKSCNKMFLNRLHKRLNTRKSYCIVNNITELFNKKVCHE